MRRAWSGDGQHKMSQLFCLALLAVDWLLPVAQSLVKEGSTPEHEIAGLGWRWSGDEDERRCIFQK